MKKEKIIKYNIRFFFCLLLMASLIYCLQGVLRFRAVSQRAKTALQTTENIHVRLDKQRQDPLNDITDFMKKGYWLFNGMDYSFRIKKVSDEQMKLLWNSNAYSKEFLPYDMTVSSKELLTQVLTLKKFFDENKFSENMSDIKTRTIPIPEYPERSIMVMENNGEGLKFSVAILEEGERKQVLDIKFALLMDEKWNLFVLDVKGFSLLNQIQADLPSFPLDISLLGVYCSEERQPVFALFQSLDSSTDGVTVKSLCSFLKKDGWEVVLQRNAEQADFRAFLCRKNGVELWIQLPGKEDIPIKTFAVFW